MDVLSIDQMPNLLSHLGKAKAARIRYHQKGYKRRQAGATNITNTVITPMQLKTSGDVNCRVSDLVTGIARNHPGSKSLCVDSLYSILQCMETINTRDIRVMLNVEKRQAEYYLSAIRTLLPFLEKELLRGEPNGQPNHTPSRCTRN